jgi:DNA polymerase-3 subunit delta'
MAWQNVIGQERIKQILSRSFINEKIPSAMLFVGNEGTGKDAVAFEFAKLLNSANPQEIGDLIEADPVFDKRWGENIFNHPNINYINALPSGKQSSEAESDPTAGLSKAQIDEIKEQLEIKAKNYYHQVSIDKANFIRVNQVRQIKNMLKMSAPSSGYRVFIVNNADKMNGEAANAFLKTIEEPAPKTCIILTTTNLELIIQTIRSRCQIIKFNPISDENIVAYLQKQGFDETAAKLIVPFAEGSISKALDFSGDEVIFLREKILELLRASLKRKNYRVAMLVIIDEIVALGKEQVIKSLKLLNIWLRDAYRISQNFDKISNFDQLDAIKAFANGFGGKNFNLIFEEIEKSQLKLKQNVNPNLLIISLMMRFREIFLYK